MKITHDDLRRAYKSHIRGCCPPSREACPPAEAIFSVFDRSVSPADKEKLIDHITGCCYCLQEFELFLAFHRDEEKAIGDITRYCRTKGSRSALPGHKRRALDILLNPGVRVRPLWKLAAASLFAIGITALFMIGIRSIFRNPEAGERGRLPGQVRLVFPVRGQEVRAPWVFRWEEIPRAEYYQLEIFSRTLLPLWKSPRVKSNHYGLLQEAKDIIRTNEVYFWTVSAWLMDGTKRESPLEEFSIKD